MPKTIRECATVKWKNKQIKLKYYKESILFNNKIFKKIIRSIVNILFYIHQRYNMKLLLSIVTKIEY